MNFIFSGKFYLIICFVLFFVCFFFLNIGTGKKKSCKTEIKLNGHKTGHFKIKFDVFPKPSVSKVSFVSLNLHFYYDSNPANTSMLAQSR